MMYENDKLNIPEEYKKMSVSELQHQKECIYAELRKGAEKKAHKEIEKSGTIAFYF